MTDLSIVVPAYNEADSLPLLVERLRPILEAEVATWEVIVVDDGSLDRSRLVLRELHDRDRRIKAICLSRNFGKERAIMAGLQHAKGNAVVLMDADLQHPPETIPRFLEKWREGYSVVFGTRRTRDTDSTPRRLLAPIFYRLFRTMTGANLPEGAGDFRLLDRKALDAFNRLGERSRFNKGLYAWIGFRSTAVEFAVQPRVAGRKAWSIKSLTKHAIDGIASFTTLPLKFASAIGVLVSLFAMLYAIAFFVKTLVFGVDIPGFPTLAIALTFLSGVQLISLGLLGEYLGRVYEEVKARPLYLVDDSFGLDEPDAGSSAAAAPRDECGR